MSLVILPTTEIIQEVGQFDELFSFYDDGIRGVVRDNVLHSDLSEISELPVMRTPSNPYWIQKLNERIVFEYCNSPRALNLYYTENTCEDMYVELIAEWVNVLVFEMLKTLFVRSDLDILTRDWYWIGNDLVVKINHNKATNNASKLSTPARYGALAQSGYFRHNVR